jgi:hypothetical protein
MQPLGKLLAVFSSDGIQSWPSLSCASYPAYHSWQMIRLGMSIHGSVHWSAPSSSSKNESGGGDEGGGGSSGGCDGGVCGGVGCNGGGINGGGGLVGGPGGVLGDDGGNDGLACAQKHVYCCACANMPQNSRMSDD